MSVVLTVSKELKILADLLCKPLQLTEKSDKHSAPLYLYELTKIIRLYVPMLYYCDSKLMSGTSTAHIMRIQLSHKDELFVTDFKNIYKMTPIKTSKKKKAKKEDKKPTSKPKPKQKSTSKSNDNNDDDTNNKTIYKPKLSKIESKKLVHRTISKKKLSPFFKCTVVAATKIDENFQLDPENNIFYTMGVGFFKEAIFVLRYNNKDKQSKSKKKETEYLKPRRVHTFGSGEGNRILSVNPSKLYKEKKNKYVILHCRALNKFFRMKYCVKTHDLKIEQWRFNADFLRIQWLISYPLNENLCVGMVVDWDVNMVILYGILTLKGSKHCKTFEIFRFKLRKFTDKDKGRTHHCYCMCYLKGFNKFCIVIEGECFLVYLNDDILKKSKKKKKVEDDGDNDDEKKNGDGMEDVDKLIQLKSSWNMYNIGMLLEKDDIDGTNYFYPKSIAQYKESNFVIGVNGTDTASMFQIL